MRFAMLYIAIISHTHFVLESCVKMFVRESAEAVYILESVVRGHHIYKLIWTLMWVRHNGLNTRRTTRIIREQ